ncbi:GATA transcription factor 8-like [Malania oleifera]|uniref:GATA transcription factor 8-like n=1 Tax=Malania oleifera TaxID=397392 RepID=UPI0025AE55FA|nr:GATA transcription factor 8-like [Malania oleifera]XP_057979620.1 GATA transcription factor 8-like [Malania oleifera]XP_057979621.1 GATA transcription factor 8-like [Malania oleifera]
MIGPNFMDEIDCGSFFDHIDDLLDFPADDAATGLAGKDSDAFPSIWQNPSDGLPACNSVFSGNSTSDLSAELHVPYEDMVHLEWLSNFVEDSFSGGSSAGLDKENYSTINKDSSHRQFQTSSPVSVLESSSSSSGGKSPDSDVLARTKPGRARSKRPRPASFNPRPAIQLISPTSSSAGDTPQPFVAPKVPESQNFADSHPLKKKIPKPVNGAGEQKIKKRKIKLSLPLGPVEMNQNNPPLQSVRKCMHCEITKTPQWRAGPMGPKTLCNACGVRYKSGRLFPEYRPAASPTFVPALHSNSHKKVLEMRCKTDEKPAGVPAVGTATPTSTTSSPSSSTTTATPPELIPNSSISLDYM